MNELLDNLLFLTRIANRRNKFFHKQIVENKTIR